MRQTEKKDIFASERKTFKSRHELILQRFQFHLMIFFTLYGKIRAILIFHKKKITVRIFTYNMPDDIKQIIILTSAVNHTEMIISLGDITFLGY